MQKLLCFQVGGQPFAAPILAVKETLPERPLTRVFLVPDFVAGLMNLRGEVVAVLDLARLLRLPATGTTGPRNASEAAIVILRSSEPGRTGRAACGLIVERLSGVRDLPDEALLPPPATLEAETAQYLSRVASDGEGDLTRPILVLDPERVLACEPLRPYRRSRAA